MAPKLEVTGEDHRPSANVHLRRLVFKEARLLLQNLRIVRPDHDAGTRLRRVLRAIFGAVRDAMRKCRVVDALKQVVKCTQEIRETLAVDEQFDAKSSAKSGALQETHVLDVMNQLFKEFQVGSGISLQVECAKTASANVLEALACVHAVLIEKLECLSSFRESMDEQTKAVNAILESLRRIPGVLTRLESTLDHRLESHTPGIDNLIQNLSLLPNTIDRADKIECQIPQWSVALPECGEDLNDSSESEDEIVDITCNDADHDQPACHQISKSKSAVAQSIGMGATLSPEPAPDTKPQSGANRLMLTCESEPETVQQFQVSELEAVVANVCAALEPASKLRQTSAKEEDNHIPQKPAMAKPCTLQSPAFRLSRLQITPSLNSPTLLELPSCPSSNSLISLEDENTHRLNSPVAMLQSPRTREKPVDSAEVLTNMKHHRPDLCAATPRSLQGQEMPASNLRATAENPEFLNNVASMPASNLGATAENSEFLNDVDASAGVAASAATGELHPCAWSQKGWQKILVTDPSQQTSSPHPSTHPSMITGAEQFLLSRSPHRHAHTPTLPTSSPTACRNHWRRATCTVESVLEDRSRRKHLQELMAEKRSSQQQSPLTPRIPQCVATNFSRQKHYCYSSRVSTQAVADDEPPKRIRRSSDPAISLSCASRLHSPDAMINQQANVSLLSLASQEKTCWPQNVFPEILGTVRSQSAYVPCRPPKSKSRCMQFMPSDSNLPPIAGG